MKESGTGEVPRPSLSDGFDSFLVVVRLLQHKLIPAFLVGCRFHRVRQIATQGLAHRHQRQRRVFRDLPGIGDGFFTHLILRHQPVQNADLLCFLSANPAPGIEKIGRRLLAYDPGQRVGKTESPG